VKGVVGDVGDEEERREDKCGHHAGAVGGDAPLLDEVEANEQGEALSPLSRAFRLGRKV
jgi:hypothetical protein